LAHPVLIDVRITVKKLTYVWIAEAIHRDLVGKLEGKRPCERGVDGRIILRWFLKK
jgi:hypothetical protein